MPRLRSVMPTLVVIAVGIVILAASVGIPAGRIGTDPGPALLPQVAGIGLIVTALLLLGSRDDPESLPRGKPLLRVCLTVVFALAYLGLMRPIGFAGATTLFVASMMWLLGLRNYLFLAMIAPLIGIGVYAMFRYGLSVPLPVTRVGGLTF